MLQPFMWFLIWAKSLPACYGGVFDTVSFAWVTSGRPNYWPSVTFVCFEMWEARLCHKCNRVLLANDVQEPNIRYVATTSILSRFTSTHPCQNQFYVIADALCWCYMLGGYWLADAVSWLADTCCRCCVSGWLADALLETRQGQCQPSVCPTSLLMVTYSQW